LLASLQLKETMQQERRKCKQLERQLTTHKARHKVQENMLLMLAEQVKSLKQLLSLLRHPQSCSATGNSSVSVFSFSAPMAILSGTSGAGFKLGLTSAAAIAQQLITGIQLPPFPSLCPRASHSGASYSISLHA
jgi:hypothetical protein